MQVFVEGVRGHIGHPDYYPGGDPYAEFLPPAVEDVAEWRAVVFVTSETEKSGQRYIDPLLVLSGAEFAAIGFAELMEKLDDCIRTGPRVVAEIHTSERTIAFFEEGET